MQFSKENDVVTVKGAVQLIVAIVVIVETRSDLVERGL
jgi:hypothetical protein